MVRGELVQLQVSDLARIVPPGRPLPDCHVRGAVQSQQRLKDDDNNNTDALKRSDGLFEPRRCVTVITGYMDIYIHSFNSNMVFIDSCLIQRLT